MHFSLVALGLAARPESLLDLCSLLSSLSTWDPQLRQVDVALITDLETRRAIEERNVALLQRVHVTIVRMALVVEKLGLNSSLASHLFPFDGRFAKLIIADILPAWLHRTIVLDLDVHFSPFLSPFLSLQKAWDVVDSKPGRVLAASEISPIDPCGGAPRLNSGVVFMDVQRMRTLGWTGWIRREVKAVLETPRRVQRDGRRAYRNAAKGGKHRVPELRHIDCTRAAGALLTPKRNFGDQEWLSHMCNYDEGIGRCGTLPQWVHANYCSYQSASLARKSVFAHFNCGARPNLCSCSPLNATNYAAALESMITERRAHKINVHRQVRRRAAGLRLKHTFQSRLQCNADAA